MATMAVLQQAVKAGANIAHRTADVLREGRRAESARGPWRGEPGTSARSSVHCQERVHHQEQTGRVPLERSLAPAASRSAGTGSGGCAPLVELPIARRFPAARHSGDLSRCAGEQCEKRAAIAWRYPCHRRSANDGDANWPPAWHDSYSGCLKMLPNVDAIIAGEVREWETVEYVRRQGVCRREEGADSRRARRVRGAWDGDLRRLAEGVRP